MSTPGLGGAGHSAHAAMIARNVLAIAPAARLYDCPLIPTPPAGAQAVIEDIPAFTVAAAALCSSVAVPLVVISNATGFGTWVFVNAWAVFDRRSDIGPRHDCDDPQHPLRMTPSASWIASARTSCSRPGIAASSIRTVAVMRGC